MSDPSDLADVIDRLSDGNFGQPYGNYAAAGAVHDVVVDELLEKLARANKEWAQERGTTLTSIERMHDAEYRQAILRKSIQQAGVGAALILFYKARTDITGGVFDRPADLPDELIEAVLAGINAAERIDLIVDGGPTIGQAQE